MAPTLPRAIKCFSTLLLEPVTALLIAALVFIPFERLAAAHPQQPIFRRGWAVDSFVRPRFSARIQPKSRRSRLKTCGRSRTEHNLIHFATVHAPPAPFGLLKDQPYPPSFPGT